MKRIVNPSCELLSKFVLLASQTVNTDGYVSRVSCELLSKFVLLASQTVDPNVIEKEF